MPWRRLRNDEFDHEVVWLSVTVGAALLGIFWLHNGWPTPRCLWHELTGIPCIACGGTRCVRHLVQGDLLGAFRMNPLVFIALGCVVLYDLYAAIVLAFRLPRLRWGPWPAWAGWTVRGVVIASMVANWAWLIFQKI
jgi:hypothetical protein